MLAIGKLSTAWTGAEITPARTRRWKRACPGSSTIVPARHVKVWTLLFFAPLTDCRANHHNSSLSNHRSDFSLLLLDLLAFKCTPMWRFTSQRGKHFHHTLPLFRPLKPRYRRVRGPSGLWRRLPVRQHKRLVRLYRRGEKLSTVSNRCCTRYIAYISEAINCGNLIDEVLWIIPARRRRRSNPVHRVLDATTSSV